MKRINCALVALLSISLFACSAGGGGGGQNPGLSGPQYEFSVTTTNQYLRPGDTATIKVTYSTNLGYQLVISQLQSPFTLTSSPSPCAAASNKTQECVLTIKYDGSTMSKQTLDIQFGPGSEHHWSGTYSGDNSK